MRRRPGWAPLHCTLSSLAQASAVAAMSYTPQSQHLRRAASHLARRGHRPLLQPVLRDDLRTLLVQRAQVDGAQLRVDGPQVAHSQHGEQRQRQQPACRLCGGAGSTACASSDPLAPAQSSRASRHAEAAHRASWHVGARDVASWSVVHERTPASCPAAPEARALPPRPPAPNTHGRTPQTPACART